MRLSSNSARPRTLFLLAALALLSTGCTGDDGTGATSSDVPTTAAPSAPTATETSAAVDWVPLAEAECAKFRQVVQERTGPIFESEGEPDAEAVRLVFEETAPDLEAMVDAVAALEVDASAAADRDELIAQWQLQLAAFNDAAASPDAAMAQLQAMSGPFTAEAGAAADRVGVAGCGTGSTFEQDEFSDSEASAATVIDVDASEYAFDVATELTAGDHVFAFQNVGGEEHEMVLVGLDESTSYEEAITHLTENIESDEEPDFMTGFWGGFAGPGGQTNINARLEAGTYLMICFIPAADEEPHFLKGMHQEVTVT